MRRIANGTQIAALPPPAAAIGTPGYATNGNPAGGVEATIWDADTANIIIEELCAVVAFGGLVLDNSGANRTQLRDAIRALIAVRGWYIAPLGVTDWTVPEPVTRIRIRVWGAGGGGGGTAGGGAAAGGAGGGYAEGLYAVTPGQVLRITVGAGGTRGEGTPSSGSAGGTSSVGSLLSATGGGGGQGAANGVIAPVNGAFGIGIGGHLALTGNPANGGLIVGGVALGSSGGGTFCTSLVGGYSVGGGNSAAFPGGGGGGGGGSAAAQGAFGANGQVVIEW